MFKPQFSITNQILQNAGTIEACREVIDQAPLIPAWEAKFRKEAQLKSIHYGTHIEGNKLSYLQAKKVVEGETVVARERDIQEVINYRNVLDFIDQLGEEKARILEDTGKIEYQESTLKKIHKITINKIMEDQLGEYRNKKVVIRNGSTGKVAFSPPPSLEVPYQIEDFFSWLNSNHGKNTHPVLRAGISHYEIVRIHPFLDGNGRVARAFAMFVLFVEGYDIKKLFSLEEHFDKDAAAYYQALRSVSNLDGDLTNWLEYFTQVLAVELDQVKEKIKELSLDDRFKDHLGRQIALSERQVVLVEYLKDHKNLRMKKAKTLLPMVSEDTILRDLKDLIKKGIVKKKGKTKGARYLLAQ